MGVQLSPHYLEGALDAYESGSTFYIEGVDSTREAAIDLTSGDLTKASIAALGGSSPHTITALSSGTISVSTTNVNFDFGDLSGAFVDSGSGTTTAVVIYTDQGGNATGDSRIVMGVSDGHSLAADGTNDDVTFAATYTFQIQCTES